MQERGDRFVRRQRRDGTAPPNGNGASGDDALSVTAGVESPPQGRRRRPNFAAQMEATRQLIAFSEGDESCIQGSRKYIEPHLDEMAEQLDYEFSARPATAALFTEPHGAVLRRNSILRWLTAVVDEPLDEVTADYFATIGHGLVRPRERSNRVKARYVVTAFCRLQARFVAILSASIADPIELGKCCIAWSKRLTMQLDVLLLVYATGESTPHWY